MRSPNYQVLILDDEAEAKIKALVAFADQHRYTQEMTKKAISGDVPPAGDYSEHVIEIQSTVVTGHVPPAGHYPGPDSRTWVKTGFRVVFSIEEQPIGWCRHLSISMMDRNKYPHPNVMEELMEAFGMGRSLDHCLKVWIEKEWKAINVLTKL